MLFFVGVFGQFELDLSCQMIHYVALVVSQDTKEEDKEDAGKLNISLIV